RSKTGMLKKVVFPHGGFYKFEFELNNYYSFNESVNKPVGGLRIKSVAQSDGIEEKLTHYLYNLLLQGQNSSGKYLQSFKSYEFAKRYEWHNGYWPYYFVQRNSKPKIIGDNIVKYSNVTEVHSDGSKTIHYFSDDLPENMVIPPKYKFTWRPAHYLN